MAHDLSRRRFLKQSAVTMGAVVVFTFARSSYAQKNELPKQEDLHKSKDFIMPHVSVKLFPTHRRIFMMIISLVCPPSHGAERANYAG